MAIHRPEDIDAEGQRQQNDDRAWECRASERYLYFSQRVVISCTTVLPTRHADSSAEK